MAEADPRGTSPASRGTAVAKHRKRYGPAAMRQHHLIPQEALKDPALAQRLSEQRIRIHQWIVRIPNALHKKVHNDGWNPQVLGWMRANPGFDRKSLGDFIAERMDAHGIPRNSRDTRMYRRKDLAASTYKRRHEAATKPSQPGKVAPTTKPSKKQVAIAPPGPPPPPPPAPPPPAPAPVAAPSAPKAGTSAGTKAPPPRPTPLMPSVNVGRGLAGRLARNPSGWAALGALLGGLGDWLEERGLQKQVEDELARRTWIPEALASGEGVFVAVRTYESPPMADGRVFQRFCGVATRRASSYGSGLEAHRAEPRLWPGPPDPKWRARESYTFLSPAPATAAE